MKAAEIHPCDGCAGELVGTINTGKTLTFYRVTVQTYIPDDRALRERAGLQVMGFPFGLADVFSSRAEVANEVPETQKELLLCFKCMVDKPLIELLESLSVTS